MAHPTSFKYFSFWSKHPLFLEVVRKAWCYDKEGVPMFSFYKKHSDVKKLKGYYKDHINSIPRQVPQCKGELSLQQDIFCTRNFPFELSYGNIGF